MNDSVDTLRAVLEAWEREAASQWETFVRSPSFLRRVGRQVSATLESHQRIRASLEAGSLIAPGSHDRTSHILYLLERLEKQIESLSARIEQLENTLRHDNPA